MVAQREVSNARCGQRGAVLVLVLVLLASARARSAEQVGKRESSMSFSLTSSSFSHQGEIPTKHTCEGDDVSPSLSWSQLPEGTRSVVLIVDDPDAPDPKAPKMTRGAGRIVRRIAE